MADWHGGAGALLGPVQDGGTEGIIERPRPVSLAIVLLGEAARPECRHVALPPQVPDAPVLVFQAPVHDEKATVHFRVPSPQLAAHLAKVVFLDVWRQRYLPEGVHPE